MSLFSDFANCKFKSKCVEMFSPFCTDSCELPFCEISMEFIKKAGSVSDSAFLNMCDLTEEVTLDGRSYFPLKDGTGYAVYNQSISSAILTDNGRKILLRTYNTDIDPRPYFQMIMRMYQYTCVFAGALLIHSAAVEYDGSGILFCGVPGAGKSTQARLWEKYYGASAVNNDQPCIIFKNGLPLVHGSPWSGKEPCYRNVYYPAKAIVFVEKSDDDRVKRLSAAEAYSLLYLNNYIVTFDRDEIEEKYSSVIEHIVESVPVYMQYCTKTEKAPQTLYNELFGKK